MADLILAAVNASPASPRVLGFTRLLAQSAGLRGCALYVAEQHVSDRVGDLAFRAELGLQIVDGDPVREIVRAAHHPQTRLVVIGANDLPHRRGLGHVAAAVATRVRRPLLVVPADATVPASLRTLLIPLEGSTEATEPILALLANASFGDADLTMVHAFMCNDIPAFADHQPDESDAWMHDVRLRDAPSAEIGSREILMRGGLPERVVPDVADEIDAGMVVVSWSQQLAPGRARLVNALLSHPSRPTLLVPADYSPSRYAAAARCELANARFVGA